LAPKSKKLRKECGRLESEDRPRNETLRTNGIPAASAVGAGRLTARGFEIKT